MRNIGDTLDGVVLRGPWSSTTELSIAEKDFADYGSNGWKIEGEPEWKNNPVDDKQNANIVFKITIPPNVDPNGNDNDLLPNALPLDHLSAWKREQEILFYNLDGKYVKILKAWYGKSAPNSPQINPVEYSNSEQNSLGALSNFNDNYC